MARLLAAAGQADGSWEARSALVRGAVGDGAGTEFLAWHTEMDLPDPEEVLANPGKFQLPERGDRAYAALASIAAAVATRPTPERWIAGWRVLGQCAQADVAAVAARVLAKCRPDGITAMPPEIRVDPEVAAGWTAAQFGSVLVHHVSHILRHHPERARAAVATPADARAWRHAADAEINDDLIAAGLELPGHPVVPADFGAPEGKLAEEYFGLLRRDERSGRPGWKRSGDWMDWGAGADGQPRPWDGGGSAGQGDGLDPGEADRGRVRLAATASGDGRADRRAHAMARACPERHAGPGGAARRQRPGRPGLGAFGAR
ncbi:MAG TPA: hypothetical protein VHZ03_52840 [Trebonia sp.]|nr:hypothetical protein [Trebonia sp.]